MNRVEFMSRLGEMLQDVSAEEKKEAIQFYNDYFDDAGIENEMHVITELGSPQKVAATIKVGLSGQNEKSSEYSETGYTDTRFDEKETPANQNINGRQEKTPKTNNALKVILIIAIIVIGGPIVLPVAFGILAVVIGIVVAIITVFISLIIAAICIMVAGIIVFCAGLTQIIGALPAALLLTGVGMLLFALGMIGTVLMVKATFVTFSAMLKGIVWVCRKPFENRRAVA
ncbi:MAG: DUF1700 domain-containing protein [Lachnospiraceae bacterium]|nr:DUF1700 domain-containing protein [Lachnospiraceae bacterium]